MSLKSLIGTGTKVWLDGVDSDAVHKNRGWGVTGATSNPAIVSAIIGRGTAAEMFKAECREAVCHGIVIFDAIHEAGRCEPT